MILGNGEPGTSEKTYGKSSRGDTPRSGHGEWLAPSGRTDPVTVLTSQNETRVQWLVPIRHWRMSQSPFAFYRGAAKLMAQDLAHTPVTGIETQICGDAHRFADLAMKVVGVGSVGTRCLIVLLQGRDVTDPFFLQGKEASRSVLEDHQADSVYQNHGERVEVGQRLMQASSDSFLGWTTRSTSGAHYYWRQLRDMKASPDVESMSPESMHRFARICGWVLARAHTRSGGSQAIAGYLGRGNVFDHAIGAFAVAYAEQNEGDYSAFRAAIETGAIEAHE